MARVRYYVLAVMALGCFFTGARLASIVLWQYAPEVSMELVKHGFLDPVYGFRSFEDIESSCSNTDENYTLALFSRAVQFGFFLAGTVRPPLPDKTYST